MATLTCRIHGPQVGGRTLCRICMEELVPDEPKSDATETGPATCREPGCDTPLGPAGCPVHTLGLAPAGATTRDPGPPACSWVEFPWGPVQVGSQEVPIGRDPGSPVATQLEDDRYGNVSRRHAVLWRAGSQLYVRDRGSMNGTFVNDRRIPGDEAVLVGPGDVVQFGGTLRGVVRQGPQ